MRCSYRVAIFVGELAAIAGALLSTALPLPERWRGSQCLYLNNKPELFAKKVCGSPDAAMALILAGRLNSG